jgi:hypothetical protein
MKTIKTQATTMSLIIVLMLVFIASSYAEIEPDSIVGAWLFDEGSGTNAVDSSGNGHDGNIAGGAEYVDGKFGTAVELDGTDDWIEVPELGNFEQVTIAEWARCTGRVGAWRVIYNVYGWSEGVIHHQLYSNNVIGFSVHSNIGGNDSKSQFVFDDSQLDVWHHLATVYNSTEGWLRFYVDGQLDVENQWGGNPVVLGPARIGSWDGGGREWQGTFDEFVIFNTALAEGDVQTLMNNGLNTVITSVEPDGRLTTTWGDIKSSN